MVRIPTGLWKKGVTATDAAKEALAKMEKMTKTEVFTTEKLLKSPSSDLFEKATIMNSDAFWNDKQNLANYASGKYLSDDYIRNLKGRFDKTIYESGDNYQLFRRDYGMEDNLVDYIEKTPLGIKSITLKNGKPYESVKKINGKEVITRYNKKTGAPLWNRKSDPNFRYYELFAEDGKTVIKEIKTPRCAGKGDIEIIEHNADGSKTVKLYINATMDKVGKIKGQVSSVEKLTPEGKTIKSILLDPDTNTIRSYANIINL